MNVYDFDDMIELPFQFENLQLSPPKIVISPITPSVNCQFIMIKISA